MSNEPANSKTSVNAADAQKFYEEIEDGITEARDGIADVTEALDKIAKRAERSEDWLIEAIFGEQADSLQAQLLEQRARSAGLELDATRRARLLDRLCEAVGLVVSSENYELAVLTAARCKKILDEADRQRRVLCEVLAIEPTEENYAKAVEAACHAVEENATASERLEKLFFNLQRPCDAQSYDASVAMAYERSRRRAVNAYAADGASGEILGDADVERADQASAACAAGSGPEDQRIAEPTDGQAASEPCVVCGKHTVFVRSALCADCAGQPDVLKLWRGLAEPDRHYVYKWMSAVVGRESVLARRVLEWAATAHPRAIYDATAEQIDAELLGRIVRETWVDWARRQPEPKQSWLTSWDDLEERFKEVDRRIGGQVARVVLADQECLSADGSRLSAHEAWSLSNILEQMRKASKLERQLRIDYLPRGGKRIGALAFRLLDRDE